MRLSEKYAVPADLALLYEFVNSLDLRRYVEKGARLAGSDELSTPQRMENWLRVRGLLAKRMRVSAEDHRRGLDLREALRSFLRHDPANRGDGASAAARMNRAAANFPLILQVSELGTPTLRPICGGSGFGRVLAELNLLSQTDRLNRLKTCASDECGWIFFDRSKPGNRRWCSSVLCGNREKTRAYRQRQREVVDPH